MEIIVICKRIFIKENYTKIEDDVSFDITQVQIRNQEQISSNISVLIKYVVDFLEYQDKIRTLSENIAMTIQAPAQALSRPGTQAPGHPSIQALKHPST